MTALSFESSAFNRTEPPFPREYLGSLCLQFRTSVLCACCRRQQGKIGPSDSASATFLTFAGLIQFLLMFFCTFSALMLISRATFRLSKVPPWPKSPRGLKETRINIYCQVRLKTRSSHHSNLQKPPRIFLSFARVGAER